MFRTLTLLFAFGLCLAVSACTPTGGFCILGYTTDSQFPAEFRTIKVPTFVNKTFAHGLEIPLTESLIREIEKRTPYKVVQRGDADTELAGVIVGKSKHVILQGPLNEIREGELVVAVELTWRDLRTGEYISNPDARVPWEAPSPLDPHDPIVIPAQEAIPVRVVRSASYIHELGQSNASARQKLADDLARQIVNMMERGW